jgi:hypothetical protein
MIRQHLRNRGQSTIVFSRHLLQFTHPQGMPLPELKKRSHSGIEAAKAAGMRIPVNNIGNTTNRRQNQRLYG